MRLERKSPCKVNLLLNILGKRPDGFHELETVLHPVALWDTLQFERLDTRQIELTCSQPNVPGDSSNLVHRAASAFFQSSGIAAGVRVHLEKNVPLAAGLGGGSGNAAHTLIGLNEMFGHPLSAEQLANVAAAIGSDIPFFLQPSPALATGRGERILPLQDFPALRGAVIVLIHPGFGIATAWAYQALARYPVALHGEAGRAQKLISLLQITDLAGAGRTFYNSLEAPVFEKYPVLAMYQEFLRAHGALAALMSGSGSTTFALFAGEAAARECVERFRHQFGSACWIHIGPLASH